MSASTLDKILPLSHLVLLFLPSSGTLGLGPRAVLQGISRIRASSAAPVAAGPAADESWSGAVGRGRRHGGVPVAARDTKQDLRLQPARRKGRQQVSATPHAPHVEGSSNLHHSDCLDLTRIERLHHSDCLDLTRIERARTED